MKLRFGLSIAALMMCFFVTFAGEQEYATVSDISYKESSDAYVRERCKLDVYYPKDVAAGVPVVVWFHGGSLVEGNKYFPEKLQNCGMIIISANYRLLPKVEIDDCIDDAAAAIAWVFREVEKYGGDRRKVFVSGHSAGGFLATMIGLDKKWLAKYGVDADDIAAVIPFSGQMISHFSYRKMKGIGNLQPTIDEYAPLFHVRKDAPPLVLITGDREIELFGRYEENAYMWRMMKLVGHAETYLYELGGHDHGAMVEPACHILKQFVNKYLKAHETDSL